MTDEKSPRDLIGPFLPLVRPYSDTKGMDELGSYEAKAKELVNAILGILDMRLASGKLTQEEFDDIAEKFRIEANFAPLIRNLRLLDPRLAEVSPASVATDRRRPQSGAIGSRREDPEREKFARWIQERSHAKEKCRGYLEAARSRIGTPVTGTRSV